METEARPELLLLHTPPVIASARLVVVPEQKLTAVEGVIDPAPEVMFTVAV